MITPLNVSLWGHLSYSDRFVSVVQDIGHEAVTTFCSVRLTNQKFGGGDAFRGAPLHDDWMKFKARCFVLELRR